MEISVLILFNFEHGHGLVVRALAYQKAPNSMPTSKSIMSISVYIGFNRKILVEICLQLKVALYGHRCMKDILLVLVSEKIHLLKNHVIRMHFYINL